MDGSTGRGRSRLCGVRVLLLGTRHVVRVRHARHGLVQEAAVCLCLCVCGHAGAPPEGVWSRQG